MKIEDFLVSQEVYFYEVIPSSYIFETTRSNKVNSRKLIKIKIIKQLPRLSDNKYFLCA